ncbi:radical SAM protein, partial [Candidatus Aerophobetes bacterium]
MPQPSYAIIAVTFKCNAKCIMCDIWKRESGQEMEPSFYQRVPSSLREINITGGEPFLREDLPEVIEVIHNRCDSPRIVISSNGLLSERIEDSMNRIVKVDPKIAVRISIDAVGKKHDELRGIS